MKRYIIIAMCILIVGILIFAYSMLDIDYISKKSNDIICDSRILFRFKRRQTG